MISLSGISSALGKVVSLNALPLTPQQQDQLLDVRIKSYSNCSDETLTMLASRALVSTLAKSNINASRIDALIICTSSYWHHTDLSPKLLSEAVFDLGLVNANLFLTSVPGCHNAITGFRFARNILVAESLSNVLVCTCDIASDDDHRLGEGPSIIGDGAGSCLLSNSVNGDFELIDLLQSDVHAMTQLSVDGDDRRMHNVEWLNQISIITRHILDRNGLDPAQISMLIPNNYNASVTESIAKIVKIPLQNTIRFEELHGHIWSSDTILGLNRIDVDILQSGDLILLLSTGPFYFGVALMRYLRK